MQVVVKKIGERAKIQDIGNDLKELQQFVGGYIETYPLVEGIIVICNEEGYLLELEPNILMDLGSRKQMFFGNILVCKTIEDEFAGLSLSEARAVTRFLNNNCIEF